jgi:hypothetical protein
MIIIFGTCTIPRTVDRGYFFCPVCQSREACALRTVGRYFSLFFIPVIPLGSRGMFYQCGRCQRQFDENAGLPFDFGEHREPKMWECLYCHAQNPGHIGTCRSCGTAF